MTPSLSVYSTFNSHFYIDVCVHFVADYVPSDDDDEDDEGALLGAANTGRLNFGGFEPASRNGTDGDENGEADPDRPRTRKEIMEEVMMKAKKHKMERQQAALETSNKARS